MFENYTDKKFNKVRGLFKDTSIKGLLIITIAVLLVICIYGTEHRDKVVTVTYDIGYEKTAETYQTCEIRLMDFIENSDVDYNPENDRLNKDLHSILDDTNDITIYKSYDIAIDSSINRFEGNIFDVDTVEELLKALKIDVIAGKIYPGTRNVIFPIKEAEVSDIRMEYVKEDLIIPCEIIHVRSDEIQIGNSEITVEGNNGLDNLIFLNVYKGDTLISHTLVKDIVVTEKVDYEVSYGYKFNWDIPENLEYIDSFDIKAVSYNFDGRPYGVYGLNCTYGTVAVDRSLIPLGTKMYIEGYGYAIANDVGSGIKGYKMDMYMEEYKQCLKWGAQYVTVYVLEYGDDTTNWSRYKRDESIKVYDELGLLRETNNWPNVM